MFNISYFCNVGTPHKKNQDRVLVNGRIINDGVFSQDLLPAVNCFVADGIGSMENSENAAQFVLEALSSINYKLSPNSETEIIDLLTFTNSRLVQLNHKMGLFRESATTLCGLLISEKGLLTVNVGDSEILLIKRGTISRITAPHVLDDTVFNSPITSYLGSQKDKMRCDFTFNHFEFAPGDILIVTTDGLRKVIDDNSLIELLSQPTPLSKRVGDMYQSITAKEAPDNLGAVFIQNN
ncbi:MAG: protein phosphatase 2C domain-containing protein [Candidatus Cloacimonetes bacterium]|nr:protein phosphatase 2C domain-containing protein [Candidatus Cloacimonadota bacterium]